MLFNCTVWKRGLMECDVKQSNITMVQNWTHTLCNSFLVLFFFGRRVRQKILEKAKVLLHPNRSTRARCSNPSTHNVNKPTNYSSEWSLRTRGGSWITTSCALTKFKSTCPAWSSTGAGTCAWRARAAGKRWQSFLPLAVLCNRQGKT